MRLASKASTPRQKRSSRELIKIEEKGLGPEHPNTLGSRNNLADALREQGKYAEAEAQDRELIKIAEKKVLGPEHPDTLRSRNSLAAALDNEGKYAEAEAQDRELIKVEEKGTRGPNIPTRFRAVTTWPSRLMNKASTPRRKRNFAS